MNVSLATKMAAGFIFVSAITYGTSAFFLFVVKPQLAAGMDDWLFTVLTLALGLVWTGILGWWAARRLTKPIVSLARAAEQAASGNLRVEIPVRTAGDEITVLYQAFRSMVNSLKDMIHEVTAGADTTNRKADSLNAAITHATVQIEALAHSAGGIYADAQKQGETAGRTLQTAEKMFTDFKDMRDKSVQIQENSLEMGTTVDSTKEALITLVKGIERLMGNAELSHRMIAKLEEEASQIEAVTGTVQEIAEQTHLLALNASIEAARAGEHGKGFHVVASEIRKLAGQSSSSVTRIHEIITQVQRQIRETVQLIQEQNELVRRETRMTQGVHQALDRLLSVVQAFADSVRHIEASIVSQTDRVTDIYSEMDGINRMTGVFLYEAERIAGASDEETAILQEISAASEELKQATDRLYAKIKLFTV